MKVFTSLYRNRELLTRLVRREVASRYRGSALGFGWSTLQPLIMLAVYTFVFSSVFKNRWPGAEDTPGIYTLNLFCGLIIFNIFAEVLGSAPRLIEANKNLVKKVVFPLELLSASSVGTAVYLSLNSLLILVGAVVVVKKGAGLEMLFAPLIILIFGLMCLGLSWMVSALAVYVKDIEQAIQPVISIFMFMSAVFYPIEMIPQGIRWIMKINPVAISISEFRRVMVDGRYPSLAYILLGGLTAILWSALCFNFFNRVRRGFADVI